MSEIGCGGFQQANSCCLSTALSGLPTPAPALRALCRLLMLYCLLLQPSAGRQSREHQHGAFRSHRLQLQSVDGALPPAAPTQSTGRPALGPWPPTLVVPHLPSGELVHRYASTARLLTAYIHLGPDQIKACHHQPHVRSKHLTDAWSAALQLCSPTLQGLPKQASLLMGCILLFRQQNQGLPQITARYLASLGSCWSCWV